MRNFPLMVQLIEMRLCCVLAYTGTHLKDFCNNLTTVITCDTLSDNKGEKC